MCHICKKEICDCKSLQEKYYVCSCVRCHTNFYLKKTPLLQIFFVNGKMELKNSQGPQLQWDCQRASRKAFVENDRSMLRLNFKETTNVKCSLSIPENVHLVVNGTNGKVDFEEPRYHINLKLTNGQIGLSEDTSVKYAYNLNVNVGKLDNFISNPTQDSYKIEMKLMNGMIEKN